MKSQDINPIRLFIYNALRRSVTGLIGIMMLISFSALADDFGTSLPPPSDMGLAKGYLTFELARNTPMSRTQQTYSGGEHTYIFGYRYSVNPKWQMAISTGFKALQEKELNQRASLWSIGHEANRIVRLYHPAYLLIGGKFMYLLPTQSNAMPPERDAEHSPEIGASFSISVLIKAEKHLITYLRVERWRGTKTTKFQGTEISVGVGFKIPHFASTDVL